MKFFSAEVVSVIRSHRGRRNFGALTRFFLVLALMIIGYTVGFHLLMLREGQEHSWITGFYWTLTVMSTLGFGDITFHTDLGRLFSILVLLSGTLFMLVLLPFTFIEFFYEPWTRAQTEARAPRQLPVDIKGHVLLANHDAVTSALIGRLEQYQYDYALVVSEVDDALRLQDLGLKVLVGDLSDPNTWINGRVESAALVVSTSSDVANTNVAFTVRGLVPDVPIITTASDSASIDILELAGSNHVLSPEEMIGQSFARRTLGGDAMSHVIGEFDNLLIAEANAHLTPLVGKTLKETELRETAGVTVVGVWERGHFETARPETMIQENTVLMLAGSREHLDRYDELFCIYNISASPVVIIGGGRVGRATAQELCSRDVEYRIVELQPELCHDPETYIHGNAADLSVLEQAGINETSTAIITTHDDDLNMFLTLYCRKLRPDIQILSRATHERNVATLHRAGADSVLSYASMGGSSIMNLLQRSKILMVAEGLDLFKVNVPNELKGQTIASSAIREKTGCSVVAISTEHGMEVVPNPAATLSAGAEIVLIGTADMEKRFLELYGKGGE